MSIENIVLTQDQRGISALRPYLAPDFCERAASLILDHPGTVLIATGFYIPAGAAPETDGPPGAIALAARYCSAFARFRQRRHSARKRIPALRYDARTSSCANQAA